MPALNIEAEVSIEKTRFNNNEAAIIWHDRGKTEITAIVIMPLLQSLGCIEQSLNYDLCCGLICW